MSQSNLPVKFYLLKFQLKNDIRRVSIDQNEISYHGLLRTIKSVFKDVPNGSWMNMTLKYQDAEEDWCSITNNDVRELVILAV